MTYSIVLFKNKIKKKIIKKFKTSIRANSFFESLLFNSSEILFDKQYENGNYSEYEIAVLKSVSGENQSVFLKDNLGRNIKVKLIDEDLMIEKINPYRIEELIYDLSSKKKINSTEFIKNYLNLPNLKLLSKLNNKIILQNDNTFNLFSLKNDSDSSRFIDILSDFFVSEKRTDVIFVKDYSKAQRKYLYSLLIEQGYSKNFLFRQSTTHFSTKT